MSDIDSATYEKEFADQGLLFEYGSDKPGLVYTPHRHGWTKLITLGGSLRIRLDDKSWQELKAGDVIEIDSDQLHEAIVGPDGWKWLSAWKPEEDDTFVVHQDEGA